VSKISFVQKHMLLLLFFKQSIRQLSPFANCHFSHGSLTERDTSVRWFFTFLAYSFPSCLDRTYLEVFWIEPVIDQGRARFCSFSAVEECTKHAYAPNMLMRLFLQCTMHFFLLSRPIRMSSIWCKLNKFLRLHFFFHRVFSKLHFLSAPSSFFKCHRIMRRMKISPVGECTEWK
jgi:hypothetical protein